MAVLLDALSSGYAKAGIVTTSGGAIYAFLGVNANLKVYKSIDGGQSFDLISTVSSTTIHGAADAIMSVDAAIDSSDVIHVSVAGSPTASTTLAYNTLNTANDTWGTWEAAASYTSSIGYLDAPIRLDSNGKPHILYACAERSKGTWYGRIYYVNKVSGSWSTPTMVSVSTTASYCWPDFAFYATNYISAHYYNYSNNYPYARLRTSSWDTETQVNVSYGQMLGFSHSVLVSPGSTVWRYLKDGITANNPILEGTTSIGLNSGMKATAGALDGSTRYIFTSGSGGIYYKKNATGWTGPFLLESSEYDAIVTEWAKNFEYQSGHINLVLFKNLDGFYFTQLTTLPPSSGSSAQTLGALSLSGTGTVTNVQPNGTLAQTLGALTVSATGVRTQGTHTASLSQTLGALALTAAGKAEIRGTATATLGLATLSGTGTVVQGTHTASLNQSLEALSLAGTGVVYPTRSGTSAQTLVGLSLSGSGINESRGAVTATLGALTLAGTGTYTQYVSQGSAAPTLGGLTLVGTGHYEQYHASGILAQVLNALTLSGTSQAQISGRPGLDGLSVFDDFNRPDGSVGGSWAYSDMVIRSQQAVSQPNRTSSLLEVSYPQPTNTGATVEIASPEVVGNGKHKYYILQFGDAAFDGNFFQQAFTIDKDPTGVSVYQLIFQEMRDWSPLESTRIYPLADSVEAIGSFINDNNEVLLFYRNNGSWLYVDRVALQYPIDPDSELLRVYCNFSLGEEVIVDRVAVGSPFLLAFEDLVVSATGMVKEAGSWGELTQILADLSLEASGVYQQYIAEGTLTLTLEALTVSATGVYEQYQSSGELVQSLGELSLSSTGTLTVVARLTQTLDPVTLTGTGLYQQYASQGALGQTLEALVLSGTGELAGAGSLSTILADVSLAATGVYQQYTSQGSLNQTLLPLQGTSTGTVQLNSGLVNAQLADLSLSGTGTLAGVGNLSATLAEVDLTASGTYSQYESAGTLVQVLGELSASGQGTALVAAQLTQALDLLGLVASGTYAQHLNQGTLTQDLLPLQCSAMGTVQLTTGILAAILSDLELAGTGTYTQYTSQGTASHTLEALALSTSASLIVQGQLAATLTALDLAAQGQYQQYSAQATLAGVLAPLVGTGGGEVLLISGGVNTFLEGLSLSGTAVVPILGTLNQALGPLSQNGIGHSEQYQSEGVLAQTLGELGLSALGKTPVQGQLAAALDLLALSGSGQYQQYLSSGSLVQTLTDLVATSNGTVWAHRLAALTQTLADLGESITGRILCAGAGALALEAMALVSGEARVLVQGTAAGTLDEASLSGLGYIYEPTGAGLFKVLDDLALTAAAQVPHTASAASTLEPLDSSATAVLLVQAQTASTMAEVTLVASAQHAQTTQAVLDQPLAPLSLTGAAAHPGSGQAIVTLDGLSLTATGALTARATSSTTLAILTLAAAGGPSTTSQGMLAQGLAEASLAASAQVPSRGTLSVALDAQALSAQAERQLQRQAALAQTLETLTPAGSAEARIAGQLSHTWEALSVGGSAAVTVSGGVQQTLGLLVTQGGALVWIQAEASLTLEALGGNGTIAIGLLWHCIRVFALPIRRRQEVTLER